MTRVTRSILPFAFAVALAAEGCSSARAPQPVPYVPESSYEPTSPEAEQRTVASHDDIRRLDIPMHDPALVRFRQAPGDLLGNRNRAIQRKPPSRQLLSQGLAFVVGHGDEGLSLLGLPDLVKDPDVGMIERGRGLRLQDEALALETIALRLDRDEVRRKELEGDEPVELEVARLEDDPLAPWEASNRSPPCIL